MSRLLRALSTLALAGLLTHCATSSGASGAASGDAVPLRFAWPEGLTIQVDSTTRVTRNEEAPEQVTANYQLRLEGQGEERKLINDQTLEGVTLPDGQPMRMPTMILGPKGELRRIEGADAIVQQFAQEAESQEIPKEQLAQVTAMVRDALEQATRAQWEALVGKWSGLSPKPGETVDRKGRTTVPLFGSSATTLEHVTLKERAPCTEGATEKRCVRLVLQSSLDPEKLDQAIDELSKKVRSFMKANMGLPDQSIPEMTVMKMRIDTTIEFIVEPDTLVPHLQRGVSNSQVVLQESEGEPKSFETQSERVDRFTPVAR